MIDLLVMVFLAQIAVLLAAVSCNSAVMVWPGGQLKGTVVLAWHVLGCSELMSLAAAFPGSC